MDSSQGIKRNYRCDRSLQQFYTGGPFALGSAPGGEGDAEAFLACACGGEVRVVSAADASAIGDPLDGDSEAITALALSPDSRLLFAAGHSRLIRVWDLASRACIRSWKGHDGPVMAMACHASGGLLATAGADKKVCVWDVDGGFCTHFFRGHTGVVTTIMFHKDPKRLLLFSGSDDGTVRVWNLDSKKCIAVLKEHFSAVTSLALSEDGQTLLSAGRDKVVNVWDVRNYSSKKTIPTYEMIEAISFVGSRSGFLACLGVEPANLKGKTDGYFLTVGERGVVRIWCLESDRTIKIWIWDDTLSDADDEVPLKAKAVVAAHDKDINSLAVSPNDGLVCSGSEDRTACIWKLPNLVSSVKGHKRGIWSVELSAVEQCVITSSSDRTV